ncbi:hypothetical protein EW145_g7366 [Phellinidium pouzarii]|uniref:Uncharacterized protein n=1 Tax=Phellinidium pouzarii TaxID=167371 RepID=A0A4S4KK43_9AGAM|nr:hypothetical protein EW145_g7366 [Phellinidium pouzarii]
MTHHGHHHHHHPAKVVINSLPLKGQLKHLNAHDILACDCLHIDKFLQGHSPHSPRITTNKKLRASILARQPFSPSATTSSTSTPIDVTNASITYTMSIGVGSPTTQYC